jgi:hypothetical protein
MPQGLERVVSRLRIALEAQITAARDADEQPADPSLSPEAAWEALLDAELERYADRVARAAELLDLDPLSVEVLWLCAAPELDDGHGQVFAFMQHDASRSLPSARLIVRILAGDGREPREVLECIGAAAPLRRRG